MVVRKFRIVVFFLIFIVYILVSATHLYGVWGWCALMRVRRSLKRRRCGFINILWAHLYFRLFVRCLGIKWKLKTPKGWETIPPKTPILIVANHQSHFDDIAMCSYLWKLGLKDGRWVLKEELKHRAIQMGHVCLASESAFVSRRGNPNDRFNIKRAAEAARIDGATYTIFPEGHRFAPWRRMGNHKHLMIPHTRGFEILRDALPNYPIMSVTINWGGRNLNGTSFERSAFCAKTLEIEAEIIPPHVARKPGWLKKEWKRKDLLLSKIKKAT